MLSASTRLLTAHDVAARLNTDVRFVYRLTKRGDLAAMRLSTAQNARLRYHPSEVDRWIAANDAGVA